MRGLVFAMVFFGQAILGQATTLKSALATRNQASVEAFDIQLPPGWSVHQDFKDNGKLVVGFAKGDDYVRLIVSADGEVSLRDLLTADAKIIDDKIVESRAGLEWQWIASQRVLPESVGGGTVHVISFSSHFDGRQYYGVATALTETRAKDNALGFLDRLTVKSSRSVSTRSLTGVDYTGKKHYFGFGAAMKGDPSMMQNEVKYDVLHTHDIFTKEIGGSYLGTKFLNYNEAKRATILKEWARIGDYMTWNDMYVQYSSGHGSQSGLEVGVSYNEIRDNALSYPAREIIIYTMACYSGNLVNSFNAKKSDWEHFPNIGRTLMVMASSAANLESATGPGTDPGEPGGAQGSAGSAFGYALWKSLVGYADGMIDGVKDDYLSLGEIEKYTIKRTKEVGGHTPVVTGAYNQSLIMNRVPPKSFLDSLDITSEGLTDAELKERIEALETSWRI